MKAKEETIKTKQKSKDIKPIEIVKSNIENLDEEIPYTFDVPNEYDDFWSLLENRTPSQVCTIIERMIKCNHPSLGADNKTKVNNIFAYILQTLQNICSIEPENLKGGYNPFSYITPMVPHLYTLTQLNPNDCSSALNEVLDEKYEEYSAQKIKKYPYFDTFVFLKVAGLLFPASDLHHVVMTRVLTFLAQMLYESKVSCGRDIVSLLFTSGVVIEYLSQSRRFLGEVSNALNGILYLAISKKDVKKNLPITPPFKSFGPFSELLVLSESCQSYNDDLTKLKLSLINEDICINDKWKLKFISETLIQLNKLCLLWEKLPAVRAIFLPTTELVEHLPIQFYPDSVRNLIENLKMSIKNLPKQVPHLRKEETVVKTLKMIDPCINDV
ncbi:Nucleolar protein 14-like protein [Armadillidium vulgare]|nr:Nucleolar protein 14-like protein [Armadillidium vulgare]